MSKPDNAVSLTIGSDLTETSLDEAYSRASAVSKGATRFFELKVPSQSVGVAMLLTRDRDISVSLDCGYDPDEWSLVVHYYDFAKGVIHGGKYEIWSPGT